MEQRSIKQYLLARTTTCLFTSIVLAFSFCFMGCEACEKTMTVTGKVADSATLQPLIGVNISCVGSLSSQNCRGVTTDANGEYALTLESTLGGYASGGLRYEHVGYQTIDSEPFTEAEAGINRCGEFVVQRDIVMTLQ